jgi:hypothetical protein
MMDHDLKQSHWEIRDHILEIALAAIVIIASAIMVAFNRVTLDVGLIVGILTAIIAISVSMMKIHFNKALSFDINKQLVIHSLSTQVGAVLETLSGKSLNRAQDIMNDSINKLKKIHQGILPLDVTQYYTELMREMEKSQKGSRIEAVNSTRGDGLMIQDKLST